MAIREEFRGKYLYMASKRNLRGDIHEFCSIVEPHHALMFFVVPIGEYYFLRKYPSICTVPVPLG